MTKFKLVMQYAHEDGPVQEKVLGVYDTRLDAQNRIRLMDLDRGSSTGSSVEINYMIRSIGV